MEAAIPAVDMSVRQTQPPLPSLRSDDSSAYWLRRRRNNEAARRCRERRRTEGLLLELHAMELLRENQRLRAALCALYPGPPTSDLPLTPSTCPFQLPYRAWTLPPLYPAPPPETATLSCHFVPTGSPAPVPGLLVHPSHAAACTSAPVVLRPASMATPTLSSLPHKLRLKGARALSCGEMGCSNKATDCGGV